MCEKNPLISVVMPVYNVENYVERCLDSIINQTYINIELIIVNDGSKDSSLSICNKFAKEDKRIKIVNKENGGLSSARNAGLSEATGTYIYFVDSDDYCEKNIIDELYSALVNTESDLSICGFKKEKEGCEKEKGININYDIEVLDKEQTLLNTAYYGGYVWNKLYDMRIIREHNLKFDETIQSNEDLIFLVEYMLYCNKSCYVNKELYHYIIRENSITQQKGEKYKTLIINANRGLDKIESMLSKESLALRNYFVLKNVYLSLDAVYNLLDSRENDKKFNQFMIENIMKYKDKGFITGKVNLYCRIIKYCPQMYYIIFKLNKKLRYRGRIENE